MEELNKEVNTEVTEDTKAVEDTSENADLKTEIEALKELINELKDSNKKLSDDNKDLKKSNAKILAKMDVGVKEVSVEDTLNDLFNKYSRTR